jgi:hypothetical protein
MKNFHQGISVLLLAFTIQFSSYAQYAWEWTLTEGDEFNEYITSVDCDNAGNIYLCGSFQGTVEFWGTTLIAAGGNDAFIAALNPDGELLWIRQGGGEFEDIPTDLSIAEWSNGACLYVTGGFFETAIFEEDTLISSGGREMFLLQYDLLGSLNWAVSGGGIVDDAGQTVTADQNGFAYVAGDINYTATFGNHTVTYYGFTDAFLAKYDDEGACLWATSGGGSIYDYGSCVGARGDDVYLAGSFSGEATFGDQIITAQDAADVYIARYDAEGNFIEVASAGGSDNERPTCLVVDENMDVYLGGWFLTNVTFGWQLLTAAGGEDAFLAKYTPEVGFTLAQSIGGPGDDEALSMDQGINNTFLLAGTFENSITITTTTLVSEGFDDGFITRFDGDGNYNWAHQLGGTGSITVRGCASDPEGNYFVGGDFVEELKVGGQIFYPAGAYDLFLSKLGEEGVGIPTNNETSNLQPLLTPNPATNFVNVSFYADRYRKVRMLIHDLRGMLIKENTLTFSPAGKKSHIIDLNEMTPGLYLITIRAGNTVCSEKLVLSGN